MVLFLWRKLTNTEPKRENCWSKEGAKALEEKEDGLTALGREDIGEASR